MKEKLLSYIDNKLNHHCSDPVELMMYFIARLSITASPVAWIVKRTGRNADKPFLTYNEALDFLEQEGERDDYIAPLFATIKMDVCCEDIIYLLSTFPPDNIN
ncbi:hypothetical protein [Pantoea septica]|jgi:peptide subunit release factor RF-3|uniref:hypothetical protein n=1 Tax=Pantoea septica TaxID=472695 RepID=UPI00289A8E59|nr:hypothetical protein [Pantoea septica]